MRWRQHGHSDGRATDSTSSPGASHTRFFRSLAHLKLYTDVHGCGCVQPCMWQVQVRVCVRVCVCNGACLLRKYSAPPFPRRRGPGHRRVSLYEPFSLVPSRTIRPAQSQRAYVRAARISKLSSTSARMVSCSHSTSKAAARALALASSAVIGVQWAGGESAPRAVPVQAPPRSRRSCGAAPCPAKLAPRVPEPDAAGSLAGGGCGQLASSLQVSGRCAGVTFLHAAIVARSSFSAAATPPRASAAATSSCCSSRWPLLLLLAAPSGSVVLLLRDAHNNCSAR
mmetsp:Transcript_2958/g.6707  ORF Transcript_2958/g.6707 Transcript_2958/m.6707 type:complete len:283 (-) Transcript_2958:1002-1850(-)